MNTQNYCYLRATRVVRLVHVVVEFYFHPTSCDRLWPNGHPAEIFLPFILGPLSVAPDMQAFEVRQLRCPALARIRNGALLGLFGITILVEFCYFSHGHVMLPRRGGGGRGGGSVS